MSSSDQDNHDNQNSKPKWTPGPWWIGPTPSYASQGQVHHNTHPITIQSKGHTGKIATVWTSQLPTEANSHLIVSAPDLYEALEALINRHDEENFGFAFEPDSGCIICTAGTVPNNKNTGLCPHHRGIRALAKARGESND